MIDLDFLERLIRAIDESNLDSLELERGGTRIRLAKSPSGGTAQVAQTGPVTGASLSEAPGAPSPVPTAGEAASPAPPASAEGGESSTEAAEVSAPPSDLLEITSPMVGTFYRAPSPDAPSYVEVGSTVSVGETLCIIEAMKLMNELPSETKGKIVEICAENGEPVEYGQVLFRVDPA